MQPVADLVLRSEVPLDCSDVRGGADVGAPEGDDGEVGGGDAGKSYQAWPAPQCGQSTEAVTGAWKVQPQPQP